MLAFLQSRPVAKLASRHPSAFLLAAQLLSLLFYGISEELHSGSAWLGAFSVIILALAVWVVRRSPATLWIAWVIAIPAFSSSLLVALFVDPQWLVWSSLRRPRCISTPPAV